MAGSKLPGVHMTPGCSRGLQISGVRLPRKARLAAETVIDGAVE